MFTACSSLQLSFCCRRGNKQCKLVLCHITNVHFLRNESEWLFLISFEINTSFRKHQSTEYRFLYRTLNLTHELVGYFFSNLVLVSISGMSFITPQPDTPPTSAPDSYPFGGLIHAALQSKEYLGQSGTGDETRQHSTADKSQSEQIQQTSDTRVLPGTLQAPPATPRRPSPQLARPNRQRRSSLQGCSPRL